MTSTTLNRCRVCLENSDACIALTQEMNGTNIADCIRLITGVKLDIDELICITCFTELDNCLKFRDKTIRNDQLFRRPIHSAVLKVELIDPDESEQIFISSGLVSCCKVEPLTKDESMLSNEPMLSNESDNEDDGSDHQPTIEYELKPDTKKPQPTLKFKFRKCLSKCCMCSLTFSSQNKLIEHVQEQHPDGNAAQMSYTKKHKFYCPLCHRRFWLRKFLEAHYDDPNFIEPTRKKLEIKKYGKEFICTFCGKIFGTQLLLSMHEARMHNDDKSFLCDECPKAFAMKRLLNLHKQQFHRHEIYICDFCDKEFGNKLYLKYHIGTHMQQKRFQCPECPKSFCFKDVWHNHILVNHTEAKKPHKCETCGKAYRWQGDLRKHKMTHEGRYPATCKFCSKGYHCTSSRNYHQKRCTSNPERSQENK